MNGEADRLHARAARPDEHGAVAALVAESNARPESQCLHSEGDADVAATKLAEFASSGGDRVVVVERAGRVVAALAADVDEKAGRLWLWGPFAVDELRAGEAFDRLSTRMLERVDAALPDTVTQIFAFPNERNELCRSFYRDRGFVEHQRHHIYHAPRAPAPAPDGIVEADASLAVSGAELHEAEFPDTYMTWDDLVAKSGGNHRLFVALDGGAGVAGYLFAERFVENDEGYVHYVAVAPHARGRGVGARLLAAALHWLFEVEGMPSVHLAVTVDRAGAQRLYERAGFQRTLTGVALRRDREKGSPRPPA